MWACISWVIKLAGCLRRESAAGPMNDGMIEACSRTNDPKVGQTEPFTQVREAVEDHLSSVLTTICCR